MNSSQIAEILTVDHRIITNLSILNIDRNNKHMHTSVPRNIYGRPILFDKREVYNVTIHSDEEIIFFQARFEEMTLYKDEPKLLFSIYNYRQVENLRREERNNVDCLAVISDFQTVSVGSVLDISKSGLKIETSNKKLSDFIEIFFDDKNIAKRATGKIVWKKFIEEKNTYLYGIEVNYHK